MRRFANSIEKALVEPAQTVDLGEIMQQAAGALRKNRLPPEVDSMRERFTAEHYGEKKRSQISTQHHQSKNPLQQSDVIGKSIGDSSNQRFAARKSKPLNTRAPKASESKEPVVLSADEAYVKGLAWLASRDYSAKQLLLKLKKAGANLDVANAALLRLQSSRTQSDQRFAEVRSNGLANRGKGPLAIAVKLSQAGIDKNLSKTTLSDLDIDWTLQARQLLLKKFGTEPPLDAKEKAKRARFLASRGFDSNAVSKALKGTNFDD
jgi:regulatory protein